MRLKVNSKKKCRYCNSILGKNMIGLNRKLFKNQTKRDFYMCLACMADFLECTMDDLNQKIEDFKEEGCKLFS